MAQRSIPVSEAEFEVLKALWEEGPSTVRALNARLRGAGHRWAYTTVQTLLRRLEEKGFVVSDKAGPAHVYQASKTREDLLQHRLDELAEQLCDGTTIPLVLALIEGRRFSVAEIRHFRTLLDRLESSDRDADTCRPVTNKRSSQPRPRRDGFRKDE